MILRNGLPSTGNDLVLDDGLQFGRGAFETLRVTDRPLFLQQHCDRINLALERLDIPRSVALESVSGLIERHGIRDCVLKILVTRENELLITRPFPYPPETYERGFHLAITDTRRSSTSPLTSIKTLNYLENLLAREAAVGSGSDDVLFLNERGEMAETTASNLFFVNDGVLYTPEAGCGLLEGIVRQWVMEMFHVRTGRYPLDVLRVAEEAFVTNSVLGIMPVAAVGGQDIPRGDFTQGLMELYEEFVTSI